jgi:hypothetical protein
MKEQIIAILDKYVIHRDYFREDESMVAERPVPKDELASDLEKLYQQTYLNDCIEKATPNLSKIKDVDKELAEIIEEEKCSRCKDISDELINWIKCV